MQHHALTLHAGPVQEKLEDRQPAYGFGGTLSSVRRETSALLEACERYAAEARRLLHTQDADEVAQAFSETKRRLEALLAARQ